MLRIGVCGIGMVGGAIRDTLYKYMDKSNIISYDLYKNIGSFESILNTDIIFICLPTLYNEQFKEYNKNEIYNTILNLNENNYEGVIVIKSTIEPTTTENLNIKYPKLNLIHNPEFLSARTAQIDFENQTHIVIGKPSITSYSKLEIIREFYGTYFSNAKISVVTSTESESMKIFCNSFYAVKVQFFTELYLLCKKLNIDYNNVKNLMLNNEWINKMHTTVPGIDGMISFGGFCLPKDLSALDSFMEKNDIKHDVIKSAINERNLMRND